MSQQLPPGSQFGGYRIIERVGRGGMATVYKAHQADLARYVAIKVLPDFLAEDEAFRDRFQHEAIAVANLRHPNIPAVYHYGHEDETAYIVTEFVDGGTLAEQTGRPLPLGYTVELLTPIASAIDYAHSRGVLHRDIKPPNILMTRDGRPVLNDFGLARMMESEQRITQGATVMGTPQYMAPEQCLGQDLGSPADIYALTVVAYEMLTGRVPFTAATPAAVIMAQVSEPLPPPRSINPDLSSGVESVLLKGLAKDPAQRYATASAMVRALAHASDEAPLADRAAPGVGREPGRSTSIREETTPGGGTGWRAGRRLPLVLGSVLLLLAAAAGAYLLNRGHGQPGSKAGVPTFGSAWTTGAAFPQGQPVPRGLPVWHATLGQAGGAFSRPELFGGNASTVAVRESPEYLDVALRDDSSRVRLVTAMPPSGDYIGEAVIAVRPGSRLTLRWVTRTTPDGDHAMALRADAQQLEWGFYPGGGKRSEVENNPDHPELFTGQPFTLTADGQQDGSFTVYLNQAEVGNFNGGHPSAASTMAFEAFGKGEFRVLSVAAYQRP
jgi:hypothetical protein